MSIQTYFDFSQTSFSKIFDNCNMPWEILPKIKSFIPEIAKQLGSTFEEIKPMVWVGTETVIAESASITGPVIIGHNTEIRHNAFIRGNAIIGDNCVVGNSCEIKNSFIFNNVQIPHFNYVGDSVLGYKSHIGAGVILSNVKSIPGNVNVVIDGNKIDTGLRKFGAILGDYVEVGCNSVLNPGTLVGKNSVVYPLSRVRGTIPENNIFKDQDTVIIKR